MTNNQFKKMALSLPGTEAAPHFDRTAFKVPGKRIFATLDGPSQTVNVKLTEIDQSVFCQYNKEVVFAVPNKWGQQGWTTFDLKKVPKALLMDALQTAYQDMFKKKR